MSHTIRARRFALAAALVLVAGCESTLQTAPADRVPSSQAIVDAPTARAALMGAYASLQSLSYYGRMLEVIGDLPTEDVQWSGTYQYLGEIDRNKIPTDNTTITNVWTSIYDGINRANMVIAKVPAVTGLTDAEKNDILGQAYFLRALHYSNLVKFWGAVPMPLAPVASAGDAAKFTRTPVAEVYAQILSDLNNADKMIANKTNTRQATVGAAKALRARVLLYMGDYAGALAATDSVMARGYSLAPVFTDLFTATGTNTPEDIFRVTFTAQQYNEMGYYYLGTGRREVRPTATLNSAFETGDVRKAATVAPRSSAFQGVKFPTTAGTEHLHVVRFAEVLLIRAEALAQANRLPEAVAEYNKLRVRAKLAPHVFGTDVKTQADVLAAIYKERRMELALEGDRWPDLVRTGRAVSVLGLTSVNQTLFPIPAREINTAPGLTQNPGY
jgi:tetratricopeptide (TPR) repeat protein